MKLDVPNPHTSETMLLRPQRMRIGIAATEFPPMVGGMEQHALGLASALSATDNITVFTHTRNVHATELYPFLVRPILSGKAYADARLLALEQVDIWLTLNAGYSVVAKHLKAPVFAYCHGNDFLNPWIELSGVDSAILKRVNRTPWLWRLTPLIAKYLNNRKILNGLSESRVIFVNSNFTKELLLNTFPKIRRSIIVSNPGVNNHFFDPPPQSDVSPKTSRNETLRLVTIARLATSAPKKNIDNIIRAIAILVNEFPIDWKIAGDGNRRGELETLAASYGIDHCSFFLGNVPNDEIPKLLDTADLFVLPSVASGNDVESFGIVYAEAAARGLPSLMSRMGGATDAVKNGRTGIIIDGVSPEDIANGIRNFWKDREKFKSDDIRAFANQFRWSTVASQMRQVIIDNLDA